jgi:glycosyltransferase involved in cell wall biosynthesis
MYKPVSVIIPCYNQGHFLTDALNSLEKCDQSLFEIIIVNDGSTDENTNELISNLDPAKYQVILQKNMGLGQARNNGIKAAKGEFILPLDADNMIRPSYLIKGLEIISRDKDVAVVYGNCEYFGEVDGVSKPGPYSLQKIMLGNYVDACAMIRKSAIEEVGYYDNMKIMGLEDWDLWLRIAFKGYRFHYIDEVLFDYRVLSNSMLRSLNKNIEKQNAVENYIKTKYKGKLDFEYVQNFFIGKIKRSPVKFFSRVIKKKFFPAYYQKQIMNNKIYNGWLYD